MLPARGPEQRHIVVPQVHVLGDGEGHLNETLEVLQAPLQLMRLQVGEPLRLALQVETGLLDQGQGALLLLRQGVVAYRLDDGQVEHRGHQQSQRHQYGIGLDGDAADAGSRR